MRCDTGGTGVAGRDAGHRTGVLVALCLARVAGGLSCTGMASGLVALRLAGGASGRAGGLVALRLAGVASGRAGRLIALCLAGVAGGLVALRLAGMACDAGNLGRAGVSAPIRNRSLRESGRAWCAEAHVEVELVDRLRAPRPGVMDRGVSVDADSGRLQPGKWRLVGGHRLRMHHVRG